MSLHGAPWAQLHPAAQGGAPCGPNTVPACADRATVRWQGSRKYVGNTRISCFSKESVFYMFNEGRRRAGAR